MRNAGGERVGGVGAQAEVVREDALPDQPGEAAAEDAGGDERAPTAARRGRGELGASAASQDRRLARPGRACRSTSSSGRS